MSTKSTNSLDNYKRIPFSSDADDRKGYADSLRQRFEILNDLHSAFDSSDAQSIKGPILSAIAKDDEPETLQFLGGVLIDEKADPALRALALEALGRKAANWRDDVRPQALGVLRGISSQSVSPELFERIQKIIQKADYPSPIAAGRNARSPVMMSVVALEVVRFDPLPWLQVNHWLTMVAAIGGVLVILFSLAFCVWVLSKDMKRTTAPAVHSSDQLTKTAA